MSLLVVESDAPPSELYSQISSMGYSPLLATDEQTAASLCASGQILLVLCDDAAIAESLAARYPLVSVVHCVVSSPGPEAYEQALHRNLAGVWPVPVDDAQLRSQIELRLTRSREVLRALDERVSQAESELRRDQRAGRFVQMGMLPPNPMMIDSFRLEHRVQPSLLLSGDFVDYFRIGRNEFVFYMADVSGHGASSAFVTVLLKNFSRRLRREYRPSMLRNPEEILAWVNAEILDQKIDKHIAMFIGVVDITSGQMRYANAGHFPPPLVIGEGGLTCLELRGKPVGLFSKGSWRSEQMTLSPGQRLVLFSDGVLDRVQGADLREKESLLAEACARHDNADDLWSALGLDSASSNPDDISCLIVTREG